MVPRHGLRLCDAVVLLLALMLPVMFLIGASEGRQGGPTVLFWALLLVPLLLLPWMLSACDREETANGQREAAGHVRDATKNAPFASLIESVVEPLRSYVDHGLQVVDGKPRVPRSTLFRELDRRLASIDATPHVAALDRDRVRVVALPRGVDARLRTRSSGLVNILLFLATLVTTTYVGAVQQGAAPFQRPASLVLGLPYSLSLMAILGVHELGHYFTARLHGVDVTPPYFIPVPMGLGTFGAFVQMKSLIESRRAVFDIGIAGPLAGLAVATPLLYVGLRDSAPVADIAGGAQTSSSLFLALMYELVHGGGGGAVAIQLSPVAFAAWVGVFITALNLLPIGQLDGGHIAYALLGQRGAQIVGIAALLLMVLLGLTVWPGLLTWALLVALIAGFSHMPTLDEVTRPDAARFALGAITLLFPLIVVLPVPGRRDGPTLDSPYQGASRPPRVVRVIHDPSALANSCARISAPGGVLDGSLPSMMSRPVSPYVLRF